MATESVRVSDAVTFEQAIALTQALLDQWDQGALSESEIEATITALVRSENGARGFFVTYLSDERPLADSPTPAVTQALSVAPDVVSPLLVKNLAMSTAMAMTHRRNQNESLAQGSDRVQSRTTMLLQVLPLPQLRQQAQQLATSIETGTGEYQSFLQRWHYDDEQQWAMLQAFQGAGLI